MSRPPHAREKVLDAFERLLIDEGARAATMDATARAAGVSKGGLLYHFGSKDALEQGIIERLAALVDADLAAMAASPEGPVAYFLRTSAVAGDPLDRVIVATSRIAQSGNTTARDALRDTRESWADALRPHTADAAALDLVLLVGDGLYANYQQQHDAAAGPVPSGPAMDALIALVERSTRA
ncbi:MAG: helix-turn-helix domain containing protein [Microbacterium sp.]|uniref:TetR/AcrR family transcriptional regulator n=1 Tax=Microbacterium sp. TaxID=51671 RepID=UPI002625BFBA|nr:helix-turn-helix domain-containing protein [Microbacterium sp.]MCX6502066.1 helix-turn-helix domain containing protein [Microbacterium sp.]